MAQLFHSSRASPSCKTSGANVHRTTGLHLPSTAPIPPAAPGFFLYPAGTNGELHALPVAPVNPTANPLLTVAPVGMLNTSIGSLPRPPLMYSQSFPPSGDGVGVTGESFEKSTESTHSQISMVKIPTSSGFFPVNYDALDLTNFNRVSY